MKRGKWKIIGLCVIAVRFQLNTCIVNMEFIYVVHSNVLRCRYAGALLLFSLRLCLSHNSWMRHSARDCHQSCNIPFAHSPTSPNLQSRVVATLRARNNETTRLLADLIQDKYYESIPYIFAQSDIGTHPS